MPTLLVTALLLLSAAVARGEVTVLRNFTLIDGRGDAPLPAAGMIIEDGRIGFVGPLAELKVPDGATVTDLSGKFLMPGIINLHGHVGNVVGLAQDRSTSLATRWKRSSRPMRLTG